MSVPSSLQDERAFVDLQHRFRGLISNFRSRRFVKNRRFLPHRVFRTGQHEWLLDARAKIAPDSYRRLLEWMRELAATQLGDLVAIPLGYDELAGVYVDAPIVSLESELQWIAERLRLEAAQLNIFVAAAEQIEAAVFSGSYEEAIKGIDLIQTVFGVSLWSVQLRLALEHLAGGLERQKRYSAEVRGIHKGGLLGFTTYHTSVRNEDRTTFAKFLDDVENRIAGHSKYTDAIKTYSRYRLKNEFPPIDAGLADILRVEQSHGLVDLYQTYVAVLQEIVQQEPPLATAELVLRCIDILNIDDFRLKKIVALLDPSRNPPLPRRESNLSNALFEGRMRSAMRLSGAVSSADPWQHIYAGFALSHAARRRGATAARPTNIAWLIARVQSRCDGSDDAWALIAKLVLNLRGMPLAAGLLEFLDQIRRRQPDQPWRPWFIGLNSPVIGPEDRPWDRGCIPHASFADTTDSTWYQASCPNGATAFPALLAEAVGHIHRGDFDKVDEALGASKRGWPEPLGSLRALLELHAWHSLGARQQVIALIASEGARSVPHAQFLPVNASLKSYAWADYKAITHSFAAPIALHLLWSAHEASKIASQMRFATGKVLRDAGVSRPSDLDIGSLPVEPYELVYFLRYVCVPDILDLSRLFSGTRTIMEERQAICGLLTRIDPRNSTIYQDEIVEIAKGLLLDDGRWIVDSTRIHVDSDAIVRWAGRELAEDYERYRDLVDVDIDKPQAFDDVLRELEAQAAQRSNFVPDNEADAVLASMLRRFGEEFLTNASFGLDYYLSKRVRHQSFIGLIRGPLEFAGLITTRESEAGEYHRNTAWIERFNQLDDDARDAIDAALRIFATKFDETLAQAKDTYFHLRSVDKPQGMLVLRLDDRLIGIARTLIKLDLSSSEFLQIAVQIMWAAIESSLADIRTLVTDEIKSQVIEEFDVVRARVREIAESSPAWFEFDAAMGRAANEVQLKLDEAAQWFVHADTLRNQRQFTLEQMLDIAVDTALKSQRGYSPEISQSTEGDLSLYASGLVFVHDVVSAGLGNARKHSGLKSPKVDINATWHSSDSTLTVSVVSDCRASNRSEKQRQADVIRKLIDTKRHSRRTRIEDGSGFAKLAAVVLQSERGRIDFGFRPDGRFGLDVTYAVIQTEQDVAGVA